MDDLSGVPRSEGTALPSSLERLARANTRVDSEVPRGQVVVWLALLFAPIGDPPIIEIGARIRLYDGSWLVQELKQGSNVGLPEVHGQAQERLESLARPRGGASAEEMPVALLRVELDDVSAADALAHARLTAATVGALGFLYENAAPSLWQVDPSHVMFRDGESAGSTFRAPEVTAATIKERVGVGRDRTAMFLAAEAERLGAHLPVGDGPIAAPAQLVRWLRDARTSPPPARLVLCDRTIEAVSAWAGMASPPRFVAKHLVPLWAETRIRRALDNVVVAILFGDEPQWACEGSAEREAWDEVLSHSDLQLRTQAHGGFTYNARETVRHVQWLSQRLPEGSEAASRLARVAPNLATPRATAAWYERLLQEGLLNERRRARTRNAIMHGGPLADGTVALVLPFAEYMAGEGVHLAFEAALTGEPLVDVVLEQATRISTMLRRLRSGSEPADALFPHLD